MQRLSSLIFPFLVGAAALAAAPALGGCLAGTTTYVVEEPVPAPRHEVVVYRPGYVYIHGNWARSGSTWVWNNGYYERERPNAVYVQGRWERRGRSHVYVRGGWRARGTVVVR